MPGGEIVPSAERGVIDCAEWVGGVEDLRLGLPQVWKYHYTPGTHEIARSARSIFNTRGVGRPHAAAAGGDPLGLQRRFVRWWVKWQKQNADAIEEMQTKHGTQILRTPPEILTEFFKAWDADRPGGDGESTRSSRRCTSRRRPMPPRWCRPSASCSRPTRSGRTTTSRRHPGSGALSSRLTGRGGSAAPSHFRAWAGSYSRR